MNPPVSINLDQIRSVLGEIDLLEIMSEAFIAYSEGRSVIPPVGELIIDGPPPGEVHIKYGYIKGGRHYVVKIASGFPCNRESELPPGNGLMLLFDVKTGALTSIIHDEAHLTDVRTAAAGALAGRTLSPAGVDTVGILGTGVQARLQMVFALQHLGCRNALVWGRNQDHVDQMVSEARDLGHSVDSVSSVGEIADRCRLLVSCTSSRSPLLSMDHVRPGTHITAVGSDTPDKQELCSSILAAAGTVVVDSIDQSRFRGEVSQSVRAGALGMEDVVEIGAVLVDPSLGRTSDEEITVADLTGVAVQDLKIAEAVTGLCT